MRGDDVEARIRQDRAELRILPGGDGHVPAVEKHVDETVTGVYRARDRAVGDSARRLERARDGEYGGRRLCQKTEIWEVPGADHCGAISTAPQEFEERVLGWFGQDSAAFRDIDVVERKLLNAKAAKKSR